MKLYYNTNATCICTLVQKAHMRLARYCCFRAKAQPRVAKFIVVYSMVYCQKFANDTRASGNTGDIFTAWLHSRHVNVVENNIFIRRKKYLIFINDIFVSFSNWKMSVILFVSVINYYQCTIIQSNSLKNVSQYDFGSKVLLS